MSIKQILYTLLDPEMMYLESQIRRRLRDAGHPDSYFDAGVEMEWLVMIDRNAREEFWTIDQHQ